MPNNYYNISYTRMGTLMLPTFLREELALSFIKAFMAPLDTLHAQFTAFRNDIDYSNYSQACYMQGLLNDHFDPLERRIKIRNSHTDRDKYIFWKETKKKPVRLRKESSRDFVPFIISRDGQIRTRKNDFEVMLPKGFRLSKVEDNKMKNLVNKSKLASKLYIITNGQD